MLDLDTEQAFEEATADLFRDYGWETFNCFDEVFGSIPSTARRPNLRREIAADMLLVSGGDVLLPKLVSGEVEVSEVSTDEQRINGY